MSNFYYRFIYTFVMVALLVAIVMMGYRTLVLSIYAIQVKVFQELQGLRLFTEKKHQDYLDWYLFAIWSIWMLGEVQELDKTFLAWLRLGCLVAYTSWFVASFFQLTMDGLLLQLGHFFWMHTLNLFTTTQVLVLCLNLRQGLYWFLLPCSLVVCNDIAAYVCGRWFGKRKLISISPNKTLEGFLGAWFITMVFGYMFSGWLAQYGSLFAKHDHQRWTHCHGMVLATYASLAAPFGGFFASALKRAKGVKDFDQWIPGHGGMTDRMDCHLLVGVFTLVYLQTF
ncbi:phosphatidate cytidylyltransferase [Chlamydoabsidia padenii]|nr:phosphatidate cytidylyltransferase [Chlamydoabsidia padenii]